ncbi:MAG: cellulase family glycosylhydrolase [Polyangiaceae bacterium]|nr:cellulase family glycosylhydrolase [Polyangiaceae bacterium]
MKTTLVCVPPTMLWLALPMGCSEGSGKLERPDDPVVAEKDATDARPEIEVVPVGPPMTALRVVGNRLQNADGLDVVLHGVNRSGTEYKCVQSGGIFDGPSDLASVAAIANWKVNAVRVPLNEACWLGINGAPAVFAGDNYKQAIVQYVDKLHQFNIVPILELHWVGPGSSPADRQQPMPDADHAPAFWQDVATTFKKDDGVILELYNEPFPANNQDSDAAWECWRDGCECMQSVPQDDTPTTYQAVGMQALVDVVRETGARNVILLGGVQWSNTLTQWLDTMPTDPLENLGAAWHIYQNNPCVTAGCWDETPAAVAEEVPLIATELGERYCDSSFIASDEAAGTIGLMNWLDAHQSGYLAWTWDAYGECVPASLPGEPYAQGQPFSLIADYEGTPNGVYGQAYHDHLAKLASQ